MGLFEVARWKRTLTANVCLSCDVNSIPTPACFEGTWAEASGWVYLTLKTHLSHGAGTMAKGSCSFTSRHSHTHTSIHKDTNSHFPCSPLSSSGCRSFFLFYISVTLVFLICSTCHLPFHAPSQKCVQVNISCLLMLKGSGSGRYVTGRELSVPRAATDKTETLFFRYCFYLLNKEYVWLEGTIQRWICSIHQHFQKGHLQWGENKALIVM